MNGERVTGSTAILDIGGSVLVNSAYLAPPYQVAAIGPTELYATMSSAPSFVDFVQVRAGSSGIRISFAQPSDVVVPAYAGRPQPPLTGGRPTRRRHRPVPRPYREPGGPVSHDAPRHPEQPLGGRRGRHPRAAPRRPVPRPDRSGQRPGRAHGDGADRPRREPQHPQRPAADGDRVDARAARRPDRCAGARRHVARPAPDRPRPDPCVGGPPAGHRARDPDHRRGTDPGHGRPGPAQRAAQRRGGVVRGRRRADRLRLGRGRPTRRHLDRGHCARRPVRGRRDRQRRDADRLAHPGRRHRGPAQGHVPDIQVTVTPVDRLELPATTRTLVPSHGQPRL